MAGLVPPDTVALNGRARGRGPQMIRLWECKGIAAVARTALSRRQRGFESRRDAKDINKLGQLHFVYVQQMANIQPWTSIDGLFGTPPGPVTGRPVRSRRGPEWNWLLTTHQASGS
jgi:hypothetical protein